MHVNDYISRSESVEDNVRTAPTCGQDTRAGVCWGHAFIMDPATTPPAIPLHICLLWCFHFPPAAAARDTHERKIREIDNNCQRGVREKIKQQKEDISDRGGEEGDDRGKRKDVLIIDLNQKLR